MKSPWWLSNHRLTFRVEVKAGRIVEAAPVAARFIGQPFQAVIDWLQRMGETIVLPLRQEPMMPKMTIETHRGTVDADPTSQREAVAFAIRDKDGLVATIRIDLAAWRRLLAGEKVECDFVQHSVDFRPL